MCGIAGIVTWRAGSGPLAADVARMTAVLAHRGPDDQGLWVDDEAGVAVGQRRLSIIDLSPQGHQPMHSADGRFVISYNGEIYNFGQLRKELEATRTAPPWRGHSDTEVLLACVEAWGLEPTLKRLVGMFAISIWDRRTRRLLLARDRLGEKPLYYGALGGRVLFASELKALHAVAADLLHVDPEALAEYMRFGYVPAPRSIHRGVFKLQAGHWISLGRAGDVDGPTQPYWELDDPSNDELRRTLHAAGDVALIDQLEARLGESVRRQMVSDVPLGAFLSGGVDSSMVVALMQAHSRRSVRTFTIGFDQPGFDEAPFARDVARHLGTEHTELYVSERDAEGLIPRLPEVYDEPFSDSSQIPTTLVSQLTRRHVTVSISGDGGDELFAGYPRYGLTLLMWQRLNRLPAGLRQFAAAVLHTPSPQTWDRLLSLLPAARRESINGRRLHRLARTLTTRDICELYLRLISQWQPEDRLVRVDPGPDTARRHWSAQRPPIEAMRLWDARQYLPDDLLVKVDRAAMSTSLETRAPLLDHRVVEFAFALPQRVLMREGVGKWILRQVLFRHVPRTLIERPKAGFAVPLGSWLRGALRPWAEELLSPDALPADGLIDGDQVRTLWREHLTGRCDRSSYLWTVLMYRAWDRTRGRGALKVAGP